MKQRKINQNAVVVPPRQWHAAQDARINVAVGNDGKLGRTGRSRGQQIKRGIPRFNWPLQLRHQIGPDDPWLAMHTAVHRYSLGGHRFAPEERLSPEEALALFAASTPGDQPAVLAPGAVADLCLLGLPWYEARERLVSDDVRMTLCAGKVIYRQDSVLS